MHLAHVMAECADNVNELIINDVVKIDMHFPLSKILCNMIEGMNGVELKRFLEK